MKATRVGGASKFDLLEDPSTVSLLGDVRDFAVFTAALEAKWCAGEVIYLKTRRKCRHTVPRKISPIRRWSWYALKTLYTQNNRQDLVYMRPARKTLGARVVAD